MWLPWNEPVVREIGDGGGVQAVTNGYRIAEFSDPATIKTFLVVVTAPAASRSERWSMMPSTEIGTLWAMLSSRLYNDFYPADPLHLPVLAPLPARPRPWSAVPARCWGRFFGLPYKNTRIHLLQSQDQLVVRIRFLAQIRLAACVCVSEFRRRSGIVQDVDVAYGNSLFSEHAPPSRGCGEIEQLSIPGAEFKENATEPPVKDPSVAAPPLSRCKIARCVKEAQKAQHVDNRARLSSPSWKGAGSKGLTAAARA